MKSERGVGWWLARLALLVWFALAFRASSGELRGATLQSGGPVPTIVLLLIALGPALIVSAGAVTAMRMSRQYPIGTGRLFRGAALHLALMLAVAAAYFAYRNGERLVLGQTGPGLVPADDVGEAISVALVYAVITGLAHALVYARRYQETRLAEVRLQGALTRADLQRTVAELRTLKLQLNPHFLFSSLKALEALVVREPARAQRLVVKLSDVLRSAMHGGAAHEISLEQEIESVRPYIDVEQVRREGTLAVAWDIDDEALDAFVPSMILQPLVEKALLSATGNVTIAIRAHRRDEWLELSVQVAGDASTSVRVPWHEEPGDAAERPFDRDIGKSSAQQRMPARSELLPVSPFLRFVELTFAAAWLGYTWWLGYLPRYEDALLHAHAAPRLVAFVTAGMNAALWTSVLVCALALTRSKPVLRERRASSLRAHAAAALGLGVLVVAGRIFGQLLAGHGWREILATESPARVVGVAVVYGMFAGLAHAIEYARRYQAKEVGELRLQAELARAELERNSAELHMLKMQLNPHFLFNALHAVAALASRNPSAAQRVVMRLSDLLREALRSVATQEVPLDRELAGLRAFVEIEQIRLGDGLVVEWDVSADARGAFVPHMILQPLVENAIKHGIVPAGGRGCISVCALRKGDWLELAVTDDGAGLSPHAASNKHRPSLHRGVGSDNVHSRLEQLYGAQQQFEVRPAPGRGTLARVRLPWHESLTERAAFIPIPAQ